MAPNSSHNRPLMGKGEGGGGGTFLRTRRRKCVMTNRLSFLMPFKQEITPNIAINSYLNIKAWFLVSGMIAHHHRHSSCMSIIVFRQLMCLPPSRSYPLCLLRSPPALLNLFTSWIACLCNPDIRPTICFHNPLLL